MDEVGVVLESGASNPATSIVDLIDENPHVTVAHSGSHVKSLIRNIVDARCFVPLTLNPKPCTLNLKSPRLLIFKPSALNLTHEKTSERGLNVFVGWVLYPEDRPNLHCS